MNSCGVCGSPAVALVTEEGGTPSAASSAQTPPAPNATVGPDTVLMFGAFEAMMKEAHEARAARDARESAFDEKENERRDDVARAQIETLGAIEDLAVSLTKLVDREIASRTPPKAEPPQTET